MSQKPNLFIVCSPLQIINAIEATNHFDLKDNILVIIYSSYNDPNNIQMDSVANYYNWQQILGVGNGNQKSKFLSYVSIIKQLKKQQYNYVFSGGLASAKQTIIANISKNKLFYIDDGVETITRYHQKLSTNKVNNFRIKYLRFWLLGLKTSIKDPINFFTYFALESLDNIQIIRNDLSYFKQKYLTDSILDDVIYFLGHPSADTAEYMTYIKGFINNVKNDDNQIVYIPHRSEVISHELKMILDKHKIKIKNTNMPVELYFLTNKITPYSVIGFNTTAFFTLKFLYPKTQYKFIYRSMYSESLESTNTIYKHIQSIGIKELKLNNKE